MIKSQRNLNRWYSLYIFIHPFQSADYIYSSLNMLDISPTEDINNVQYCEGVFKKNHELLLVDILKSGKEKLISDKVTKLRLNKRLQLEQTD